MLYILITSDLETLRNFMLKFRFASKKLKFQKQELTA